MWTRGVPAGALILLALAATAPAQPIPDDSTPHPADLTEIVTGVYDGRIVRTRGMLSLFKDPDLMASAYGATVVVVPMRDMASASKDLVGRWVEMVGRVQDRGTAWPRVSILVSSLVETAPPDGRRPERSAGRLGDHEFSPSPRETAVIGRFCGVNLCGSLTDPPPSPGAWVLQDGDAALWVTGRSPRGKGWSLDPNNPGDTRHWIEVLGRLERCGAVQCLRAKRIRMAKPLNDARAER